MRWHSCRALASEDLVNLAQGRMIETIRTDQSVPHVDGGLIVFPFAMKFVGIPAYVGFYNDQPYVLRPWQPV